MCIVMNLALDLSFVSLDSRWLLTALAIAYALAVLWTRWYMIALPSRAHYRQHLAKIEAASAAVAAANPAVHARVTALLAEAVTFVPAPGDQADFFTLRRGRQVAGWRLLHEAERALVATWTDDEVNEALVRRKASGLSGLSAQRRRARLVSLMAESDNERDSVYEGAASVSRRAFFIMLVLLVMVPLAGGLIAKPVVLVLGAIGGALSRAIWISRVQRPAATDYGLHWWALILSPPIGALCAATGLLLVSGLGAIGVVGTTLQPACTDYSWSVEECTATSTTTTTLTPTSTTISATPTTDGSSDDTEEPAADANDFVGGPIDPAAAVAAVAPTATTAAPQPIRPWRGGLPGALSPIAALLAFMFGFSEKLFNRWIERAEAAFDPDPDTSAEPPVVVEDARDAAGAQAAVAGQSKVTTEVAQTAAGEVTITTTIRPQADA